jgi:hypothetical protein
MKHHCRSAGQCECRNIFAGQRHIDGKSRSLFETLRDKECVGSRSAEGQPLG